MSISRSFVCLAAAAVVAAWSLAAPGISHARTLVPCLMEGGDDGYFSKPRTCEFHVGGTDGGIKANTVYVKSLRWRRWGKLTAKATGVQVGNGGFRDKLTVTLSGRERCDDGDWLYRKVTMRARGEVRFSFRLVGCPL